MHASRARAFRWVALVLLGLAAPACSIRKMAVNSMGDSLAEGGAVFARDDDPQLIEAAAPFSLKLMESLLEEVPEHQGLLFATASGFTQYAYGFVEQNAEDLEDTDIAAAEALRTRARKLYLRARDYGLRGLEVAHEGFEKAIYAHPQEAVQKAGLEDVRMLYWTACAWGAAISVSKDDPDLIGGLPQVEALMDRALALDEKFDSGAIHSFLISYEMSRTTKGGEPEPRAREHFKRAVELSEGLQAAPYVALAESTCVKKNQPDEFKSLLEQALAIDVNARKEWRLANLVYQRRARRLLAKIDELFLLPAKD